MYSLCVRYVDFMSNKIQFQSKFNHWYTSSFFFTGYLVGFVCLPSHFCFVLCVFCLRLLGFLLLSVSQFGLGVVINFILFDCYFSIQFVFSFIFVILFNIDQFLYFFHFSLNSLWNKSSKQKSLKVYRTTVTRCCFFFLHR